MSFVETLSSSQSGSQPENTDQPAILVDQASDASLQMRTQSGQGIDLLHQIALISQTTADPEIVLPFVAGLLGRKFQVDCCLVAAQIYGQSGLQIACWQPGGQATLEQVNHQVLQHPFIRILTQTCDPLAIADIPAFDLSELLEGQERRITARAVLAVPNYTQDEWHGFIVLIRSQPYYWTAQERDLLNHVAAQLALPFTQIIQHSNYQSLQSQMQVTALRQALIERLTLANRNAVDLNDILNLALQGTLQALQVDSGLIALLKYPDSSLRNWMTVEEEPGISRARAIVVAEQTYAIDARQSVNQDAGSSATDNLLEADTPVTNNLEGISFSVSECRLCQQALANSPKPLEIPSINALLAEQMALGISTVPTIAPIFAPQEMPAAVIVPLESQHTVLGVLVLQHHQIRRWHAEDLMLLELVAAQVSTAILQTQTLRQVQALVEERTAQLQHSLEVQGKLYETTRRQIDQLRQLNQMKDEFLSTVSHELLTPLTSMTLAIRMLRQPNLEPERQAKYLDILEKQCAQETNLINDLLALQKLEVQQVPVQLQRIEVATLIRDLLYSFSDRCNARQLTCSTDLPQRPLFLKSDQQSLQRVLSELISNAVKYAAYGSTIHFKVESLEHDSISQVVFTLSNMGLGIATEDLPHIFSKFRRGQGATQRAIPGTGLGLALVQGLVQHLRGTIAASSTPLENSSVHEVRFTLMLPQFYEQIIG